MEQLFGDNILFLYFLGIIVIVNYEVFSKKQKIMLIYVCTYGLMLCRNMSVNFTCTLLLGGLFVYEEFLSIDSSKYKYINNLFKRVMDFAFLYLFSYKIGYIILAIIIFNAKCISTQIPLLISFLDGNVIRILVSALLVVFSCERIYNNPLEIRTYKSIERIFNKYPYYAFTKIFNDNSNVLFNKLQMVAQIEDKTYMKRQNGFSVISLNYIMTWVSEKSVLIHEKQFTRRRCKSYSINHLVKRIFDIIKKLILKKQKFLRIRSRIKCFLIYKWKLICDFLSRKKRRYLRGYSTIEMQLIRTLAISKGLVTGKPKNIREAYCVIVRKIYELLYTDIFFSGLKNEVIASDIKKYRSYLLYIYLHSVSTKINGKRFNSVDKIFSSDDVANWPNELIFVATLGLTYQKITEKRVERYAQVIEDYGLDRNIILDIINNN